MCSGLAPSQMAAILESVSAVSGNMGVGHHRVTIVLVTVWPSAWGWGHLRIWVEGGAEQLLPEQGPWAALAPCVPTCVGAAACGGERSPGGA